MKSVPYSFEAMGEVHRQAVIDIYNHFIRHSMAAYPEAPVPYATYDRFLAMTKGFPAFVVKDGSGRVVGFSFLRPYLAISTFKGTAEITYFILPDHTGKGIGGAFLGLLLVEARRMGIQTILASISSENGQSLSFHRKNGFMECGCFKKIGNKNGAEFDMVWMQKDVG
jgi:L-amino acid N-acyltransferase YncA